LELLGKTREDEGVLRGAASPLTGADQYITGFTRSEEFSVERRSNRADGTAGNLVLERGDVALGAASMFRRMARCVLVWGLGAMIKILLGTGWRWKRVFISERWRQTSAFRRSGLPQ